MKILSQIILPYPNKKCDFQAAGGIASKTSAGSEPLTTEYCMHRTGIAWPVIFFHLKKVIMYIRRFKYKPDDVDCRLCTELRKRKCTPEGCPWIAERIETGVISYAEAVIKVFFAYGLLRHRLAELVYFHPGHSGLMNGTGTEWNG